MVKQSPTLTNNEIGDAVVDSWTQEKVTLWLQEKGWGQFASTFEAHGICREKFFQITLAELVHILPRTVTTYYERRRLLNEIRSLVPSSKKTPTTPTNISINTNIHDYNNNNNNKLGGFEGVNIPPNNHSPSDTQQQQQQQQQLQPQFTTRDSGIGYLSHYSAGSSSSSPSSLSPSSTDHKKNSPTKTSYSPKAALNKLKNTFRSTMNTQQLSPGAVSPRLPSSPIRHESVLIDENGKYTLPAIPARVSSTPDKISKFWHTYTHWNTSPNQAKKSSPSSHIPPPEPIYTPKKMTDQKIQITGDKETWYSLNVTNMRDPVAIKRHILQRMNYTDDADNYLYFYENGPDPDTPMDPQELMYLCSIADHSANQRILVKHAPLQQQHQPPPPPPPLPPLKTQYNNYTYALSTPELGNSPTTSLTEQKSPRLGSPSFKPLSRKTATRPKQKKPSSVGIQLSDPPTLDYLEQQQQQQQRFRRKSIPTIIALPPSPPPNNTQPAVAPSSVGLWAIAPQKTSSPIPPPPQILPPRHRQQQQQHFSPMMDNTNKRNSTSGEFWGERPPAEVVFKHMEHYFDSKDLDKEVVVPVEPTNNMSRRLTHTKSIRLVAREASRKFMKEATRNNSKKSNRMLRRKSTKLWGQKVVEVKSRSSDMISRLPSVSEHMKLSSHGDTGDEVQWIRGKLIGKGSFGRVYLAFNVGTGEVIAVKQVEIPRTASDKLNEHQQDMVTSLYSEIMMLRDLDHENIVQYLGYGHDDAEGVIHIFLEYVSGGSVASRVTLHGAFDEPLTTYFTRQICAGLEYLHSKNILHRDIKAANILVEVDGVCKISDFGLSKKNDYDEVYDQNSRMSLRGSIYWMAPEVVKNDPYSAKVDIWSLGCTVLEMLTGERPWMSLNQIAALYNLGKKNAPSIPNNISDCAKDFLKQCFTIDPAQRPTATELLNHPFLILDKSFQFKDYVDKGRI